MLFSIMGSKCAICGQRPRNVIGIKRYTRICMNCDGSRIGKRAGPNDTLCALPGCKNRPNMNSIACSRQHYILLSRN